MFNLKNTESMLRELTLDELHPSELRLREYAAHEIHTLHNSQQNRAQISRPFEVAAQRVRLCSTPCHAIHTGS
jgi:hypothetical protein